MTYLKFDGGQSDAGDDAPHVSRRRVSRQVSVISMPGAHIIQYKWADPRFILAYILLPILSVAAFMTYAYSRLGVHVPSFVEDLNALDYVALTIGALGVGYFVAILTFNRTTTVITDTTLSVRRGPVPCPWPGDYVRPVDEVREVAYIPHNTVNPYGFVTYTVFVTFRDGEAARLFFLIFERGQDERPAVELANQVQAWIDEKKRGRPAASSAPHRPRAQEIPGSPFSRAQRRRVVTSILATLIALATLVVTAEYFAARHRASQPPKARGR